MKTFNSLEEINPYYNEKTDTYEFIEDGDLFDVYFKFDLKIIANIKAWNIKARNIDVLDIKAHDINAHNIKAGNIDALDINAHDIKAWDINACDIDARDIKAGNIDVLDINAYDINAWDINACDINYWAVCFACCAFKCKSIVGRRENAKHFCLDDEIIIR